MGMPRTPDPYHEQLAELLTLPGGKAIKEHALMTRSQLRGWRSALLAAALVVPFLAGCHYGHGYGSGHGYRGLGGHYLGQGYRHHYKHHYRHSGRGHRYRRY